MLIFLGLKILCPVSDDCFNVINRTVLQLTSNLKGFWHEHSRPDRDEYIDIQWDNIRMDGIKTNFNKQSSSIDSLGAPYDYNSVMHYHSRAFNNKNGSITIKTPVGEEIGQRRGISNGDKLQMRLMYQCRNGPRTLAQFHAERCNTDDCKCGKNWKGCGQNDSKCKGRLVCVNNRCKNSKI